MQYCVYPFIRWDMPAGFTDPADYLEWTEIQHGEGWKFAKFVRVKLSVVE